MRQLPVFPNNSVKICSTKPEIVMLYYIKNTFQNAVLQKTVAVPLISFTFLRFPNRVIPAANDFKEAVMKYANILVATCNFLVKNSVFLITTPHELHTKTTMELDKSDCFSGGYDLEIFDEETDVQRYICVICKKVLKNAIQLQLLNVPERACLKCYRSNIR